jgi:hypothetical protein
MKMVGEEENNKKNGVRGKTIFSIFTRGWKWWERKKTIRKMAGEER